MAELDNIESFLFVDEVKNTAANKDGEDSFYYFAVSVSKEKNTEVSQAFSILTKDLTKGFHAKDQYKPSRVNQLLLDGITDLIVKYTLPCICFRYDKNLLYTISNKHLKNIHDAEISERISNWEFQAFFYFIQNLHHAFKGKLNNIQFPVCAFFDRGIYGMNDKIEGIDFNSEYLKRAIFTSKKKIKLLGLPDHLGYIFSKARISFHNREMKEVDLDFLNNDIYAMQLLKLAQHHLFKYLEADQWLNEL